MAPPSKVASINGEMAPLVFLIFGQRNERDRPGFVGQESNVKPINIDRGTEGAW
jgi:hypothetical protein